MKREKYKRKEILFSPLSSHKCVFVLNKGFVKAYTISNDGNKKVHLIYGPNSYFPILTSFDESKQQRATYEAMTDVDTLVMSTSDFLKKIEENHSFSTDVLKKTVDQIAVFADRIINLEMTNLATKLEYRLHSLLRSHGALRGDMLWLPYKLSHQDLAEMFGVGREAVSRVINETLEKTDLSRQRGGYYGMPK